MLKIVVFDAGWGGEVVARYLETELETVQIVRIIDWEHAPYDERTLSEVYEYAESYLREYIGKVDLIVLGGYTVTMTIDFLRIKYPEQKFVGMGINYYRILRASTYPDNVTIIMNSTLIETDFCQEIRDNLPFSTVALPDCSGWEELANAGELSRDILYEDLAQHFIVRPRGLISDLAGNPSTEKSRSILDTVREEKKCRVRLQALQNSRTANGFTPIESDVVLILNTNFWDNKIDLEEIFGYRVRVLDFRQKLLHDTCAALGLRGVHGDRSK